MRDQTPVYLQGQSLAPSQLPPAYYRIRGSFHLGDRWARFNYALRLIQAGERFAICLPDPLAFEMAEALDLSAIDAPICLLSKLEAPACRKLARRIDTGAAAYRCKYFPTRHRNRAVGNQIGYCFSANWRAEEKVPPGTEEILASLQTALPEWTLVPVGKPHQTSILQLVEMLAQVRLLLCVDNGVAHVARSVGTPLFLLEHTWPVSRGFSMDACQFLRVTRETAVGAMVSQTLTPAGEG